MAGFQDLIGHEETIRYLQTAIEQDKVSHAYIIQGDLGSGKRKLAEAFAITLQCESETAPKPCGVCHSCRQALSGNHPDILYVSHEKDNLIKVDEIRDQLVTDVQVRPYNGKYKIYIVPEAQKMNAQAQNALLKTLEEPPSYAVILLLTNNADALLDTIRSRCVLLDLKPVKEELVIRYLMDHLKVPDYQARLCAAFAQGSIGRAASLAGSEAFQEMRALALRVAGRAKEADITALTEMVRQSAEYKGSISDFLEILAVWFRDLLYFKATRSADSLIFRDQLQEIRAAAKTCSYEGIEGILSAIGKAKARLDANVSFDVTMELLLLTIRENL